MDRRIYLDHAATTQMDKRVLDEMIPYFCENYGNANSQHAFGRDAMKAVDFSRDKIAKLLKVKASEIYFTSGGTESDNWALRGIAKSLSKKGKHIIISKVEHAGIISTAKDLEKEGFELTYLDVDKYGSVDLEQLKNSIRDDTILIAIMYANNEVGTIQPISEIVKIAKENKVICFTDAVQAVGALKIDLSELKVDMMSFSGHKFNGPKGVGCLFIRTGTPIARFITGGHQERTMRGGTTNVPSVVGIAKALELTYETVEEDEKYVKSLRDFFIERVLKEVPYVRLNGSMTSRLPNNANFSFEFIEGESILFMLDLAGIAVSSGSACSSGSLEASHVLLAMGVDEATAHGSIRFTFGKDNTMEEVNYTVDKIKEICKRLRDMSPLFKEVEGEITNV